MTTLNTAIETVNNYIANFINAEKLCEVLEITEEKFDEINQKYRLSSDSAIDYTDEKIEEIAKALIA